MGFEQIRSGGPDGQGGALSGLRVIDATAVAGAYCSKLLADLGADVVKVEPVTGDWMRRLPPFKGHVPHPEGSLVFAYYHVNKRGVTLDRTAPGAQRVWERLVETADVVLHDYAAMSGGQTLAHEEQIVCTITPYGVEGPYRDLPATHLTSSAMGGAFVMEKPGMPPVAVPDLQMYDGVGGQAALAILVALRNRPAVGGQFIEVAAHEVLASKNMAIQRFMQSGHDDLPSPGDMAPPAGRWQCSDGKVEILVFHAGQWEAFKQLLGNPPALTAPELATTQGRRDNGAIIADITRSVLAGMSKMEVFERAQALRIPCAPINRLIEFVNDPQTNRRGTFSDMIEHPYLGSIPAQRVFVASEPLTVLDRAAPLIGQHNHDIYVRELGFDADELEQWRKNGLV